VGTKRQARTTSLYRKAVRALYSQFGASGSNTSGTVKSVLSTLKKLLIGELKKKALLDYVPVVNIVVGLAEDSIALFQIMSKVNKGTAEMTMAMRRLNTQVSRAQSEIRRLDIRRADLIEAAQKIAKVA
jgi:hypothetical protein